MHYSSQFNKPSHKYKPDWLFLFTCLVIIVYLLISQRQSLLNYYETWVQRLPQRQVMEGVSQKEIALAIQPAASQPTSQETIDSLLPSYTDSSPSVEAGDSANSSFSSVPARVAQTAGQAETPHQPVSLAPDRLVIPSLDIDTAVIAIIPERITFGGTPKLVWPVPPASEAGWHSTSAEVGVPGNTVINGHNYPQDAIFRNLYKVQPGDEIRLYAHNLQVKYVVVEILILPEQGQSLEKRQANARYIQATQDERLTLVTCYPYASLANRLIVIALPETAIKEIMN